MAKQQKTEQTSTETLEETQERLKSGGKGVPTPTRAEQEAARKRPLVPSDRKEAAKQARAKAAEARERARVGMAMGDDKYLPARDRGPQKKFVRDYVDARFSIGEILIPVMFLVIILTFVPSAEVQAISILVLWAFFAVAVLDCILLGYLLTKKLRAKYGDKAERVRWYAAMRALQLRPLRLPKPQVKRGQYPA
ncbi:MULTISPECIES: DUF3043 domain-containing protein [Agromyces]|uniref:DUF3043 domain-containing protein n=1 Tax=Agromyces mediolanus TaxID=41986 RepID=A0A918FFZ7_AGRME|nr:MULTISPECIES: DUF3043 domain-containing protein [Agromyces]MCD1573305.1 DUF3043 domain-containing protein [Agromyces mediolanus]GGR35464.1 hypothetical protein GCM10010196_31740 [Agromyces mediolanus]GLJ73005.1 hypothetical protein GCM10017583_22610 [Agromyces mediolanus]GLU90103.1 hypothetical protein Agsp01_23580 [Agromyces sp. NBRC 114283]